MPLSSAFNPSKPPNIKDVTWTPEKKSVEKIFDPERDITEEDWKGMLKALDDKRRFSVWDDFSLRASQILTLFPERRAELNLGEPEFQTILASLNKSRQEGDWNDFSSLASKLLTFFPERRAKLNLSESDFQTILDRLNKSRQEGNFNGVIYYASILKIILADEIKRKEDGTLDIIFNKPKATELKEEIPPLPITRNY